MKIHLADEVFEFEDTINVVCPHCGNTTEINDYCTLYNLYRTGSSIHSCGCNGRFKFFYDGNNIKTLRLGKHKC